MTNIFKYNGRIGRLNFILTFVGVCILMGVIDANMEASPLQFFIWAVLTWILICASIKRFHDLGNPGVYAFLILIPFAPIYVASLKGNTGTNQYGRDPLNSEATASNQEGNRPTNASEHVKSIFTYKKVFNQDDKKEVENSNIKYCRQCGKKQTKDSMFCSSCGKSFA